MDGGEGVRMWLRLRETGEIEGIERLTEIEGLEVLDVLEGLAEGTG